MSDWALVLVSELATVMGMASAYPLELALVSELVTASASESLSATVLSLVSESLLVLDSDSVAAWQSRWFQARRIVRTPTTARESRITNRISFFISVPSAGPIREAADCGELITEAEATETAEVQACGSSQSLRERGTVLRPQRKVKTFTKES